MNEHFFADVNLPFHVWVREPSGTRGFRWVLRDVAQSTTHAPATSYNTPRGGPILPGSAGD